MCEAGGTDVESVLSDSFHAAGHAVAAALRSWSQDWRDVPEPARAFVRYAGPWAQARLAWEREGCTSEDARGRTFEDYVAEAMLRQAEDATHVGLAEYEIAQLLRDGGADERTSWRWMRGVHQAWRGELEDVWPVVAELGTRLAAGQGVEVAEVQRLTNDRLAALYC